jgi:hypothetical protein
MWASVTITPTEGTDVNPSNNWVKKMLCRSNVGEIATGGEIIIHTSPKYNVSIHRGTSNEVHAMYVDWWLSKDKDTFEANIQVRLMNYGCTAKTFDNWLYVDKSPGQFLGKVTLDVGESKDMTFPNSVKIKLPPGTNQVQLVFVADPGENNDQPYPNSYMNNFIPVTLRIVKGGTVTGSGW